MTRDTEIPALVKRLTELLDEADLPQIEVEEDERPDMSWNRHLVYNGGADRLCFMAHSGGKSPERDEARAELIATALNALPALLSALTALGDDRNRLDFLDECNRRLNAHYGTEYGWRLILNHNVTRLMLGRLDVDLHDSEGGNRKLPSCRAAIDEHRFRLREQSVARSETLDG